jgi:putative nucleotidyltransferase with HDIG domain
MMSWVHRSFTDWETSSADASGGVPHLPFLPPLSGQTGGRKAARGRDGEPAPAHHRGAGAGHRSQGSDHARSPAASARLRHRSGERSSEIETSELEALHAAALLHDIGKLAVPEHIISKPGRLTPEEFEKMKIHTVVGAEILERVRFPYPVVPIVRAHHEKWDGSGYPFGLKGTEIPIGARILSAVDYLDALASDRQYRRALPLDEVMRQLSEESGKSFDPKVVEVLKRRYKSLENLAKAKSKEGADPPSSTEVKVSPGPAPDAGFESQAVSMRPAARNAAFCRPSRRRGRRHRALFELSQDPGSFAQSGRNAFGIFGETETDGALRRDRHLRSPRRRIGPGICEWRQLSGCSRRCAFRSGTGLSGWVAQNLKAHREWQSLGGTRLSERSSKFSTLRSALAVPLEGVQWRDRRSRSVPCRKAMLLLPTTCASCWR